MRIRIDRPYLTFAVRRGAPRRHVRLLLDGLPVRAFSAELDADGPDFVAYTDVSPFTGRDLTIDVDGAPPDAAAAPAIASCEDIPDAASHYHERLRPLVHFSTRRGWSNDPNGLVYCDGEYHLFYQHNPFGLGWGSMHWAHAVSSDLLHWQELGEALYPDEMGQMWSGSGVVDEANTSGLGLDGKPPLVFLYTAAGGRSPESEGRPFTQCLAYSNDKGRTLTKLATNPVLGNIVGENRDPKVVWDAGSRQWVMALWLEEHRYGLFGSPDLKQWRPLCDVGLEGAWECPDIFALPIGGEHGERRWVFWGANGTYVVGRFDGQRFRPESDVQRLSWGDTYAAQTWDGAPGAASRPQIAWLRCDVPGMPFTQMMAFPVDVRLLDRGGGPRLAASFVPQIDRLHRRSHVWRDLSAGALTGALLPVAAEALHVRAELEVGQVGSFSLLANGEPLEYRAAAGELRLGRQAVPLRAPGGVIVLDLLIDRTSVELLADGGCSQVVVSAVRDDGGPPLAVAGPWQGLARRLEVHELESIW